MSKEADVLTIPPILTHKWVTIFGDDEDPNLFYTVPTLPHLRMDGNKPVFRALFWTDAADGAAGSVAGVRGALLNFDVNLAIPDAMMAEIEAKIKSSGVQQARVEQMVREERERLEKQRRATGSTGTIAAPRVPPVGGVRFAQVRYTEGMVTLLEEKSGGFVEWSSAGGPPSMMADNNSAFALRLGPEGAAVWYRALEKDATAIGIRYELKFEARLPSLQIHVWAGSHKKLEIERKAKHVVQNMDQGCSDADVARVDVKEISEKLTEEQLINVEIIKGSAKISDEQVSQLRNAALGLISDRVKEIIQHKIRGMTEEERKNSVLEKVTEEVTSFAELRLTQRDVIEWPVNPQATITDFLGGMTGEARKKLITLVDLSDPIVSTLEVPVSVAAAWTGEPAITSVIVKVTYPAGGDSASKEMSFDAANAKTTFRWRRAKNDKGLVKYTAKAFVKGAAAPIPLPPGETNGAIHIEVPTLGAFKVKARAHPDTFTLRGAGKITSVQVKYTYKDERSPDRVSGSVIIRPEDAEGRTISHTTFREINAPLKVKATYFRENNPSIEGEEQTLWMTAGEEALLEIPFPFKDTLRVEARVAPGIPGLTKTEVTLQHTDTKNSFDSDASIMLDADGEWQGKTSLVQLDKANQKFRYRYSVQSKDQLALSPWVDAEGEQTLVLPLMAVRLRLNRLQLGSKYGEAVIRVKYTDTSRKYETTQEFFVTDAATEPVWLIPRVDSTNDKYTYSLELFPVGDGPVVEVLDVPAKGSNLILQLPATAGAGGGN
jgi:hypothetical protein